MTTPYHEKQRKNLCALHAVNGILQTNQVTQDAMNIIAEELFQNEQLVNPNVERKEYYSALGDYQIQVIIRALATCGVNLLRFPSIEERLNPSRSGVIIQANNHWIALRRIQTQWWDLDSHLPAPRHLPNFNLTRYVEHLEAKNKEKTGKDEKASIFIVRENTIMFRGEMRFSEPELVLQVPLTTSRYYTHANTYKSVQNMS